MNKISAFMMEKWNTIAGLSTIGMGMGTAAIVAPELGFGGILVGLAAAGATAAGTAIFRPRSQEEVEALLGIEPVHISPAIEAGETKVNIKNRNAATKQLNKILGAVVERQEALGQEIIQAFTAVCDNLNAINKQWDRISLNVEMEYTVETILSEHLPNSLEAYINVSKNERINNQDHLKAEVIRQLNIMEKTTSNILDSFERQDVNALETHGRFLESRFANDLADEHTISLPEPKKSLQIGSGKE